MNKILYLSPEYFEKIFTRLCIIRKILCIFPLNILKNIYRSVCNWKILCIFPLNILKNIYRSVCNWKILCIFAFGYKEIYVMHNYSTNNRFSINLMFGKNRYKERCQSGRLGRSRKPLYPRGYPGFESLSLRKEYTNLSVIKYTDNVII